MYTILRKFVFVLPIFCYIQNVFADDVVAIVEPKLQLGSGNGFDETFFYKYNDIKNVDLEKYNLIIKSSLSLSNLEAAIPIIYCDVSLFLFDSNGYAGQAGFKLTSPSDTSALFYTEVLPPPTENRSFNLDIIKDIDWTISKDMLTVCIKEKNIKGKITCLKPKLSIDIPQGNQITWVSLAHGCKLNDSELLKIIGIDTHIGMKTDLKIKSAIFKSKTQ